MYSWYNGIANVNNYVKEESANVNGTSVNATNTNETSAKNNTTNNTNEHHEKVEI